MSSFFPVTPLLSPYPLALKASLSSCRALRALMDRRRMDAEGGRVVHRDRRAGQLAVVVAVQNVLVAACLLVTLFVYWETQGLKPQPTAPDDIHIEFEAIPEMEGNDTLKFNGIQSRKNMSVAGEKNETISIECTGPYILYMDVCYKSKSNEEANGTLRLLVVGQETHLINFDMQGSREICRGLHSVVYLRAKEKAALHLYSTNHFKIKNATVGLNYMLGSRCIT
ncbi:uncharacterized protein LOC121901046 [Thunnus maccoyii]|uniref:uncharacterized protein LOC121901046 n=1 Tax=Thunnus maccoyii TaxID=8240 RepID=UPI001C4DA33B|nr:uncharacterized protein LOC121901046 [Thunnus maccoyii]